MSVGPGAVRKSATEARTSSTNFVTLVRRTLRSAESSGCSACCIAAMSSANAVQRAPSMADSKRRVQITGVSRFLGLRLAKRLEDDDRILIKHLPLRLLREVNTPQSARAHSVRCPGCMGPGEGGDQSEEAQGSHSMRRLASSTTPLSAKDLNAPTTWLKCETNTTSTIQTRYEASTTSAFCRRARMSWSWIATLRRLSLTRSYSAFTTDARKSGAHRLTRTLGRHPNTQERDHEQSIRQHRT